MEGLTRFGIRKSRLTVFAMIAVLLIGALSYVALPKRENPALTIRSAVVTAQFPGMSPQKAENLIAVPLERAAREIGEVDEIATLVTGGSVQLTINLRDSVPIEEIDRVLRDLRQKMEDAARQLPEGTDGPFVNTDYGDVAVATIAVTGEGFTPAEITKAAEDLRTGLYLVDGVTKVTLSGVQAERIWLEIDAARLAAIGVQLSQVLNDLRAQNVILPAGELNSEGTNITLEANGDLRTIEEIEDVLPRDHGVDDHDDGWRHESAQGAPRGDGAGGEVRCVAALQHLRQGDPPEGGRGRGRGARRRTPRDWRAGRGAGRGSGGSHLRWGPRDRSARAGPVRPRRERRAPGLAGASAGGVRSPGVRCAR